MYTTELDVLVPEQSLTWDSRQPPYSSATFQRPPLLLPNFKHFRT